MKYLIDDEAICINGVFEINGKTVEPGFIGLEYEGGIKVSRDWFNEFDPLDPDGKVLVFAGGIRRKVEGLVSITIH